MSLMIDQNDAEKKASIENQTQSLIMKIQELED